MDIPTFRSTFQAFASTTDYPDAIIALWSGISESLINADRWGDTYTYGVQLCTAHHLAVAARETAAAATGASPGAVTGPKTSQAVDKVSVSYDTSATTYEGAAFWNQSSYGIQFYRLMLMFGAGGLQL